MISSIASKKYNEYHSNGSSGIYNGSTGTIEVSRRNN